MVTCFHFWVKLLKVNILHIAALMFYTMIESGLLSRINGYFIPSKGYFGT